MTQAWPLPYGCRLVPDTRATTTLTAGAEYWLYTGSRAWGTDAADGWERFIYQGSEAEGHKFTRAWDGSEFRVRGELTIMDVEAD